MKKIKWIIIGAVILAAGMVPAATWTNGVSGDRKFSTPSNWVGGVLPLANEVLSSEVGTTATNHALVDPAFNIAFGNATIAVTAGTAYVDVLSGATLKGVNINVGNSSQGTQGGDITLFSGGTIVANAGNSGFLFMGLGGSGKITVEAGAAFGFSHLTLGTNGIIKFVFGTNSVSTFNSSRTTVGGTNLLNGRIQVDLSSLTSTGSYTLVNGIANVLDGTLYTWLNGQGGSQSGTGSFTNANFEVINGGNVAWALTLADSNRDLVLNVTAITKPKKLGLIIFSGQ